MLEQAIIGRNMLKYTGIGWIGWNRLQWLKWWKLLESCAFDAMLTSRNARAVSHLNLPACRLARSGGQRYCLCWERKGFSADLCSFTQLLLQRDLGRSSPLYFEQSLPKLCLEAVDGMAQLAQPRPHAVDPALGREPLWLHVVLSDDLDWLRVRSVEDRGPRHRLSDHQLSCCRTACRASGRMAFARCCWRWLSRRLGRSLRLLNVRCWHHLTGLGQTDHLRCLTTFRRRRRGYRARGRGNVSRRDTFELLVLLNRRQPDPEVERVPAKVERGARATLLQVWVFVFEARAEACSCQLA